MSLRHLDPEALASAHRALVASVHDRLAWNVMAYGKAWTEEGEDTEFLCSGAAEKAVRAYLKAIEHKEAA